MRYILSTCRHDQEVIVWGFFGGQWVLKTRFDIWPYTLHIAIMVDVLDETEEKNDYIKVQSGTGRSVSTKI